MTTLHQACLVEDLPPGLGKTFCLDGKKIAVFNVDGTFYAITSQCTHEGTPLGDGPLRGTRVLCPSHGAEFDVTTGEALSAPASYPVPTYRVVVEGGEVKVEL